MMTTPRMKTGTRKPSSGWSLAALATIAAVGVCVSPAAAVTIPTSDPQVRAGLSPYTWVQTPGGIGTAVCGGSLTLGFKGTRRVVLQVDTSGSVLPSPLRYPILAWTVNGGPEQTHQLAAGESAVVLATDVADPVIDLYVKGMSPFEDRFTGDRPPNSVWFTGFEVDDGATTVAVRQPERIWLSIGDSITSGDGAAHAEKQGRPHNDRWAESDAARASYAWLLARHYGYRESRLAYGGYNWKGGLAKIPAVPVLMEQRTSTVSRLDDGMLRPSPDVVLVNLGTNGRPTLAEVEDSLAAIRRCAGAEARLIVMVPVSGAARAEVTAGFKAYRAAFSDPWAHLVDLGKLSCITADGVHPTAAGHGQIFAAARPIFDEILGPSNH